MVVRRQGRPEWLTLNRCPEIEPVYFGGRDVRGWIMVAACALGLSTNPGQFAYGALGVFMLPLTREFGWSRTDVSLALMAFTVALALTLPLVGWMVDRHGGRRVLLPSVITFAILPPPRPHPSARSRDPPAWERDAPAARTNTTSAG